MNPLAEQSPNYPKQVDSLYLTEIKPPLLQSQLLMALLIDNQRDQLRTPIIGDTTLTLIYKGFEVAVISYLAELNEGDLEILQLQGAKSRKSFRANSGVLVEQLFADETLSLATLAPAILRITMGPIESISGISEVKHHMHDRVARRYKNLLELLHMKWSHEEDVFIVDVD